MYNCNFCNKACKSANALRNHERLCKSNPNRQVLEYWSATEQRYVASLKNPANQYMKARREGLPKPEISAESRAKRRNSSKAIRWTDEQKAQHSRTMRQVAKDNPESYTSSNRGRTRQIIVDNIKFQSKWEVEFYQWAKENNLNPQRPIEGFPYQWDGVRTYFPDFYIPSLDLYVETKGYETDRDHAKWAAFPHKLKVLRQAEIKSIRNGTFSAHNLI